MKANIPTRKTQTPSREGLVFHEIVADGLIHAAHVFGIADDERFVERVLNVAWVNAARLVQSNFWQAATIAKSLSETLEVGIPQAETLCRKVGDAIMSSTEDPFAAIRTYYAEVNHCCSLDSNDPEHSDRVRQLIGEALLGGLLSRGVICDAFNALIGHSENTCNEQRMISNRLIYWASNKGLPRFHPFMELCVHRYDNDLERDLLCSAIGRHLPEILEQPEPWSLEHWLNLGWKDGLIAARFAPDEVKQVIQAIPAFSWEFNQRLYRESVLTTSTADGKVKLLAAYNDYVTRIDPYGFTDESVRTTNPRLAAWSAYDFAFWMSVIAIFTQPHSGDAK